MCFKKKLVNVAMFWHCDDHIYGSLWEHLWRLQHLPTLTECQYLLKFTESWLHACPLHVVLVLLPLFLSFILSPGLLWRCLSMPDLLVWSVCCKGQQHDLMALCAHMCSTLKVCLRMCTPLHYSSGWPKNHACSRSLDSLDQHVHTRWWDILHTDLYW